MSQTVELVVVRKDHLDALINAAANVLHERHEGEVESVIQDEALALLQAASGIQSRPVLDALRHIEASGNDADEPILAILPPGVDSDKAAELIDQAVKRAASISADGESTPYFEELEASLAQSSILITQEINNLSAGPWDQSDIPAEPSRVEDDDPEWVRVVVSGQGIIDSDNEPQMELPDGTPVQFKADADLDFLGFVENLTYKFPRGDKYGVPEAATESGAREFVVDELGFACSRKFEVMAVDTRDDSISSYVAECVMPRDILEPVDRPGDRMRA